MRDHPLGLSRPSSRHGRELGRHDLKAMDIALGCRVGVPPLRSFSGKPAGRSIGGDCYFRFAVSYSWKDKIRNYGLWQRAIAFFATLFVIFVFLPKEKLFKFEYQLKQPWKHEKLIAPFDFGIRKTPAELQAERQDIIDAQPPIFRLDNSITDRILLDIDREVRASVGDSNAACDTLLGSTIDLLGQLMQVGLIERSNAIVKEMKPIDQLFILHEGQLVRMELRNTLNIQEVLDTVATELETAEDTVCSAAINQAVLGNLAPNALYDDSITQRLLQQAFDEMIAVKGKINKGQAIIDRGDIVEEYEYDVLESLRAEYDERTISRTGLQWSLLGEIGIVVVLLGLLVLFIYLNEERIFNDARPVTLALSLVSIAFVMCSMAFVSDSISVFVIPIGIAPLLLRMFYDFRISIFTFITLVLIIALFSPNPLEFTIIQVCAISFATLYQASSTKRSRMLGTAMLVFLGYSVIYTFISVAQSGNWTSLETENYGWFAINGLLCTLVFPLIYIVEKVFGYISETTLLELSESNQPLLHELAIKAPGTFQHSLQVANLCEKVAARIGGNSVLLRTASMYHDIGKMNEPQFFIENQLPENNPHDDLEPEESASIIIKHVIKGVELARYHKIPMDIIQFIQTHHGTSTVRFFLKRAQEKAALTGAEVDIAKFTYPGPKPKTKEHAILMMADSVEAASRSLKKYDAVMIDELVDKIIDHQISENQFINADITFRDINQVKKIFKKRLMNMYHVRIEYPR